MEIVGAKEISVQEEVPCTRDNVTGPPSCTLFVAGEGVNHYTP